MVTLIEILLILLGVVKFFVIAHVIMSWLVNFQVLNLRQPIVAQIWYGLGRILEPLYNPIRKVLPNMGGLDLTPLAVLIAVIILERILINNLYTFA